MTDNLLKLWGFSEVKLTERLHPDSPRLIYKVIADGKPYILKGIPEEKSESVIAGNISAHKYLGSEKGIAPRVFEMADGGYYTKENGFWFYLMEFIAGTPMSGGEKEERLLGELARRYHSYTDYDIPSGMSENKYRFYEWFHDMPFKREFDGVLDTLPDLGGLDRCFIHTDLGPHNAIIDTAGNVRLIDLDDAGIGCRFLDLGYSLICQFVEHDDTKLWYRFDLAKALLGGYYSAKPPRAEYDSLWHGAVYMHISYMKCFGDRAVFPLWRILKFGIEQKETLWDML